MNDMINGTLEFMGALLVAHNCWVIFQHERVQGVSVLATAFFTTWGAWNLYFYPMLHLWLSFTGGLCLALANFVWVGMAVFYSREDYQPSRYERENRAFFRVPRLGSPRSMMRQDTFTFD